MADFDLGSLDTIAACNAGAEIELSHPVTKAQLGVFVGIVGKDSDAFNDYVETTADADRQKAFVAQRRNKVPDPKKFRDSKRESVDLLIACTTSFRTAKTKDSEGGPYVMLKGEKLTFNETNAKKFYTSLPWAKDQIDAAIIDYENFIKS